MEGGSKTEFHLARGLMARGHDVDLVLLRTVGRDLVPANARVYVLEGHPEGDHDEPPPDASGRPIRVKQPVSPFDWLDTAHTVRWDPHCLLRPRLIRQIGALARYAKTVEPDIILLNITGPRSVVLLACPSLAKFAPVIAVAHSYIKYRRYRYRARYRRLFVNATQLVGVSHGVSSSLAAAAGAKSNKVKTIYNGVEAANIRDRMRAAPSCPELLRRDVPIVLATGRLTGAKDYPTLIRAFARLASRRACHLIILGEGKARSKIERLVRSRHLTDRVSLPGWVENPFAYMSRASLFVVSSRREGFSMVLLEALSCGCPCVSTDCHSGPAEILQNGKYGPLVPVGNDAALADAMERVLDNPPDKRVLQERAALFSTDQTVAAYDQLISTVGRRSRDLSSE